MVLLMEEILHHLGCKKLVNHGINYLSTGAGFLETAFLAGKMDDVSSTGWLIVSTCRWWGLTSFNLNMMSTGAVMGEVPAFETSCRASIYIVGIGREFARIYLKLA